MCTDYDILCKKTYQWEENPRNCCSVPDFLSEVGKRAGVVRPQPLNGERTTKHWRHPIHAEFEFA